MVTSKYLPMLIATVMVIACAPALNTLTNVGDYFGCAIVIIGAIFTGLVVIPWVGWMILSLFNFIFDVIERTKFKKDKG